MADLNPFDSVTVERWRAQAEADLRGRPLSSLRRISEDGDALALLYTETDAPAHAPAPGFFPFIRGRDRRGFGCVPIYDDADSDVVLRRVAHDRALGSDAVLVLGDPGAAAGFAHEGRGSRLEELASRTDALGELPVLMHAGVDAMSVHQAMVRARPANVAGGVLADPLGAWMRYGSLRKRLQSAYEPLRELVSAAEERGPSWRCFAVDTVSTHRAGATPVAELVTAMAAGIELLRRLEGVGVSPDRVAPRVVFLVSLGPNVFEEAAKLRALRRVWAAATGACGIGGDGARAFVHARTSGRVRARRDPWLNLLRGTAGAMAAALGGADLLATGRFDDSLGAAETHGRGSQLGDRLAINAHAILRAEARVDAVLDPAGGSYYLEARTEQLAAAAWAGFQDIEKTGGLIASLRRGDLQRSAAESAKRRADQIARGEKVIIGVNRFAADPTTGDGPLPGAEFEAEVPPTIPNFDGVEAIKPFVPVLDTAAFDELVRRVSAADIRAVLVGVGALRDHKQHLDRAADVLRSGGVRVERAGAGELSAERCAGSIVAVCGTQAELTSTAKALLEQARQAGALAVAVGCDSDECAESLGVARLGPGSNIIQVIGKWVGA